MGMVGCLGDIVFTVSDRTIEIMSPGLGLPGTRPISGTAHTPLRSSPALTPTR